MQEIEFHPADLADIRFAHSPMAEVVTSTLALFNPHGRWMYERWRAGVTPLLAAGGLRTFVAVLNGPAGYIPDFLNPVPAQARPSLDDELALIAATPLDEVVREVTDRWAGHRPPPEIARLIDDPAEGLRTLVAEIRCYFELAIAPVWSRLSAAVEADIAHHRITMVDQGPRSALTDLHPDVHWTGEVLQVAGSCGDFTWQHTGQPLTLLPCAFNGPNLHVVADVPTGRSIWYPPRDYGRLWDAAATAEPSGTLAALLGPTRATILTLLAVPHTTTEVAAVLSLAPATVSHHLTTLRDAGLVAGARTGRHTRYLRTALGEQLARGSNPSGGRPEPTF